MLHPLAPLDADKYTETKMVCMFPDSVAQGDSSANTALTNDKSKLTVCTDITPFPIGIIGPNKIMATGKGIMKLITQEGHIEGFTTYYSKDSSSSVISPE